MHYDLVIKGGRVVDPAADLDGRMDIGIIGSTVAAVEPDIPAEAADRVIHAQGKVVTPGLIDMHTHVFWGRDYLSIDADSVAWRSGVTTWVDAGSAGAFSMPGFREYVVKPATARILAFINISYLGIPGMNYDEYCNPEACNVPVLVKVVEKNRDLIVGIKTRMGKEGVCYPGLEPLRKAIEASEATGLRVMCHLSGTPPSVEEVLELLRPGDMVTHSFTGAGERLINEDGTVREAALQARARGVLFDVGHGAGSFAFRSAEALAAVGFFPDTISTDLHLFSLPGRHLVEDQAIDARVTGDGTPQQTLLTVMTKFLFLGMSVGEIIRAVTARPAELLGRAGEIGTLRPGAQADIAVLEEAPGDVLLFDIEKQERHFDREFRCALTLVAGKEMPHKEVPQPPPWIRMVDLEPDVPAAPVDPA